MQNNKQNNSHLMLCLLPVVVLVLSACGQFKTASKGNPQFKFAVQSVPKIDGQTTALIDRLSAKHATEILKSSFVSSIETVDIVGEPFFNLVFFTPSEITEPLIEGLNFQKDMCDGLSEADCAYSTSITGADTTREMISSRERGVKLLYKISQAVESAGGSSQMKRIVAFNSSAFYLETKSGAFIDIETNKSIDIETLTRLSSQYLQIKEKHVVSEEFETMMKQQWQAYNEPTSKSFKTSSERFRIQKLAGGNLDLNSMVTSIDQKTMDLLTSARSGSSGINAQSETEYQSCFLWWCRTSRVTGRLEAGDKPYDQIMGGYSQHGYFAMKQDNYWTKFENVPSCSLPFNRAPGPEIERYGYASGCATGAMMSLIDWWWRYKNKTFFGKQYNGEAIHYTQAQVLTGQALYKHIQEGSIWPDLMAKNEMGYAQMTSDFGGCFYRNGTLALPSSFVPGGTKTLARAGASDMRIEGDHNYIGGNAIPFFNNTLNLAARLRQTIGQRNIPAVVLYPLGSSSGGMHYSPVQEFDITYNVGSASIRVRPVDNPDRMVSITDPWSLGSGVFNLTD